MGEIGERTMEAGEGRADGVTAKGMKDFAQRKPKEEQSKDVEGKGKINQQEAEAEKEIERRWLKSHNKTGIEDINAPDHDSKEDDEGNGLAVSREMKSGTAKQVLDFQFKRLESLEGRTCRVKERVLVGLVGAVGLPGD